MIATLSPPPPEQRLLTAEEFFERYEQTSAELVKGVVVEDDMPNLRHGQVCSSVSYHLSHFVRQNRLGTIFINDSHILIRRNPDTVRGPDVCFISFERLPTGPAPEGLTDLIPELAVEVRSPSNTWTKIFGKVGEYLERGVTAVLVIDPDGMTASVYRGTGQVILYTGQELTLPDVLPGFAVPVVAFFE